MSPFKFSFSNSHILPSPTPVLEGDLELGPTLGKGHFGVVRQCIDKKTGERLACKTISKAKLRCWEERDDVRREVEIMGILGKHPNIVSLREAYEDDDDVHLAMDLCEGGELFDEISSRGPLPERHAAQAVQGIAQALVHCHAAGVLHRDLKPENILLVRKADRLKKLEVKLADFGLSVKLKAGECTTGLAGSPYYLAPEVLAGSYGHMADIWSLGVVLFMMLSETAPFYGDSEKEILGSIRKAELRFMSSVWDTISDEAKDLVSRMLQKDPSHRPTAKDLLGHPWVVRHTADVIEVAEHPNFISRSCSSATPRSGATAKGVLPSGSTDAAVAQHCQSLPRVSSKASELLTWLSPQLAGAPSPPGLEDSPLLHKFNEAMSELEDGIHYFVLDEADCKDGTKDLRLHLAQLEEPDCKTTCRQEEASAVSNQAYEPTPEDALDWIFGL